MAQININNRAMLDNNKSIYEVVLVADQFGNTLFSSDLVSDAKLSAGSLTGLAGVHKFGMVESTPDADWTTVWTAGSDNTYQLYDWSYNAGVATISSDDAGDTGVVRVSGLDASFNEVSEDINLTGTTPSSGSTTFSRVNRAYMLSGNDTNVGNISVTVDSKLATHIAAEYGQTLQCFYTIPAGKTGYLKSINVTTSKNQECIMALFARAENGVFVCKDTISIRQYGAAHVHNILPSFAEKTDLEVRIKGATGNNASVSFDILLIDN